MHYKRRLQLKVNWVEDYRDKTGQWTLERVVVSQNEFLDSPRAFGRFLWWKMGFQNSYFPIKVKMSKYSKLQSDNFII